MNSAAGSAVNEEVIGQILERVRRGEKVRPLAEFYGVPPRSVYEAAHVEGIPLRRGRLPMSTRLYRRHFNRKHGPGSAARFLKMWNRPMALRPLGREFGLSGEGARYAGKRLADGAPKERPVPKNTRSDLTPQRIRWVAERCSSTAEVCSLLKAGDITVRKRVKEYGINLPKGKSGISAGFLRRPDLTPERVRWHARHSRSIGELAVRLHCAITTALSRAKKHKIKLPLDFWRARREAVHKCASVLGRRGFQAPEITKVLRISNTVAYAHGRSPETKYGKIIWADWRSRRRRGVEICVKLLAGRGWSAREISRAVIVSRRIIAQIKSSQIRADPQSNAGPFYLFACEAKPGSRKQITPH